MQITRRIIDICTQVTGYMTRKCKLCPKTGLDVVKLNLGCGLAVAKGWINVDGSLNALAASWPRSVHQLLYRVSGANRYYTCEEYCALLEEHQFIHHDLAYGIPFVDESVNSVYSSHFLEHLHRQDALHLLQESFRVLKHGGVIRICVPDLAYAISLYTWGEKEKMLNDYFFVEDKESYYARHKYMYDFDLLSTIMKQVGFRNIRRCAYRQGATPDLEVLDNRLEETHIKWFRVL